MRPIDADELITILDGLPFPDSLDIETVAMATYVCHPIDAEPVKHGRWINGKCSECGCTPLRKVYLRGELVYEEQFDYDFCPNCGAKMDEVEE